MLLDLTQPFHPGMPQGGALDRAYSMSTKQIRSQHVTDGVISVSYVDSMTHVGTHMDAGSHFLTGAFTISDIPLATLTGRCHIVHVPVDSPRPIGVDELRRVSSDPHRDDIVFVRTGWSRFFNAADAHRYLEHPYLLPEVAHWWRELGVKLVGVDTISPDPPPTLRSPTYGMDVHMVLLSAGIPIIENLAIPPSAPPAGLAFAFPLHYEGADGAPVRVVLEDGA